jgi:signal transduction histidine kinase
MNASAHPAKKTLAESLRGARRWVILAMMLSLHAALMSPIGSEFERVWLLVHFGLFLIWQPFVSTDRELNIFAVLMLVAITTGVLYFLSSWMLVAWLAILIGIMGGKVFTLQRARRGMFYLVAVFYLFTVLLIWAVPIFLLGITTLPEGLRAVVTLFLPLVLLAMTVLPYRAEDETTAQVFDFFYSLLIFQLVVVLILGGIAAMRVTDNQYFQAVLLTVFSFSTGLIVLAVLWGPRAGFGGLRVYFSRYLMSVGMPFELWMRRIAVLSENEASSQKFLRQAMDEVAIMPWLKGATWNSPDGPGSFGDTTAHESRFQYHALHTTFYSDARLSPALVLHLRLLAQVVGEFYEGKRREQTLKQNTYMQAVHETGARLTHDIKNLLQSLYALTSAGLTANEQREIERHKGPSPTEYEVMLHRQLPQLTKRLQTTLDKLQNPEVEAADVQVNASEWWADVVGRYAHSDVALRVVGNIDKSVELPATVFDAVLENCVDNALQKKRREPEIEITVEFSTTPSPTLSIKDNGSAIPAEVLENLFRAPIENSPTGGLGIGLFQARGLAWRARYVLTLSGNVEKAVCMHLSKYKTGPT